jgi:hypothetical protein
MLAFWVRFLLPPSSPSPSPNESPTTGDLRRRYLCRKLPPLRVAVRPRPQDHQAYWFQYHLPAHQSRPSHFWCPRRLRAHRRHRRLGTESTCLCSRHRDRVCVRPLFALFPTFPSSHTCPRRACLYTCLAGIVVIYSLNYRSVMRQNPHTGTAPSLRPPSTSGFNGESNVRRNSARRNTATTGIGLGVVNGIGENLTRLSDRLSSKRSGGGGERERERERGLGAFGAGRRGSTFTGQISVSQTVSHVETQLSPEEELPHEDSFLGPGGWSSRPVRCPLALTVSPPSAKLEANPPCVLQPEVTRPPPTSHQ